MFHEHVLINKCQAFMQTYKSLLIPTSTRTFERLHGEPCRTSLEVGQEADHLGRKGKSRLMGKDVRPLQSVKLFITAVFMETSGLEILME